MGCKISTAMLQSCLTQVLADFYMINVIVYCDDILIFTEEDNPEAHLQMIAVIIAKLNEIQAKIKLSKVQLCREEIIFLGLKISQEGMSIAPKFIDSVLKADLPKRLTELRSFIGLANWQHLFQISYSFYIILIMIRNFTYSQMLVI